MEIYINESSFHGQFFDKGELEQAFKIFFSVLNVVNDLQVEYKFYKGEDLIHLYKAFHTEVLSASINQLRDKSLTQAIFDLMYNRLHARDWKYEQIHSKEDTFLCEDERVTETSLAELAERTLRDHEILAILINFPMSKYRDKLQLCVTKNELHSCDLNCVEEMTRMADWLGHVLNLRNTQYDYNSGDPPRDQQTVLRDASRFQRTRQLEAGRKVYKEVDTGRYWYVDNLHNGQAAHLEVFDIHGLHLGEASLDGVIDNDKQDSNKKIDI